jgi:hypothetical protein
MRKIFPNRTDVSGGYGMKLLCRCCLIFLGILQAGAAQEPKSRALSGGIQVQSNLALIKAANRWSRR